MLLQFNCPGCRSLLEADLARDALEVVCPICERTFSAAEVLPPEQLEALPEHAPPGPEESAPSVPEPAQELELGEEPLPIPEEHPSEGGQSPAPELAEAASGFPPRPEAEGPAPDATSGAEPDASPEATSSLEEAPAAGGVEAPGEEVFGNYALISQVGTSDVAVTYRARHLPTGVVVALKVLLGKTPWAGAEATRIMEHLRSLPLSQLEHPNLAKVFEMGEVDGVPFIATEFVEGRPFSSFLESEMSESEVLSIVEAVADGLAYAHREGVVHGDIKPSNIIIDSYGNPMLVDFGFFRSPEAVKKAGVGDLVTASRSGYEFPYYAAPEQIGGEGAFVESDIYSLGAVMYRFLTGRPPLTSDNLVRLCLKVRDEPPPPPRHLNPGISAALQSVILKCLAKRPQNRYHDCQELRSDIHRLMVGQPVRAGGPSRLRRALGWTFRLAALLLLAASGVAAYWYLGQAAEGYLERRLSAPAAVERAYGAARRGDLETAERILRASLEELEGLDREARVRHLPGVYYFLARVRERAGDYRAALDFYRRMLDLLPDDPAALEGAGRCSYLAEDYRQAEAYFNRLLAVRPDRRSRVCRALALWGLGRLDEAEELLRRAGDTPQVREYLEKLARLRAAGTGR